MKTIQQLFGPHAPIIAVITLNDKESALPIAEALMKGGITLLEITLRTPFGLAAIESIKKNIPDLCVGAGTLTRSEQFLSVKDAGAEFAVSPGFTPHLVRTACQTKLPFLPGVITPSEIISAMEGGLSHLKFFPAEKSGGIAYLNNLAGPFPDISFCPTGGITNLNYQNYLSSKNVFCVGSTWLTPPEIIHDKNWKEVEQRAKLLSISKKP